MSDINLKFIPDHLVRKNWETILDQAYRAVEKYQPINTSFLTPAEWIYAEDILNGVSDLSYSVYGGYDKAERKVITMKHCDLTEVSLKPSIHILSIEYASKFHTLTHRDYLGSILSLGIKREKIGDLLVKEKSAIVFVLDEMAKYIALHLTKIGNCPVKISEMSNEEVHFIEPVYTVVKGSVASLRVDSLISLTYKLSRKEAQTLINQEKVKINWKSIHKSMVELKENDTLSVAGYGRAVLLEVGGTTRSDRRHVKIGRRC